MLKIDNLSNEIEMTAVRGGSQTITQVGSAQLVSSGFGGLVIAAQNNPQSAGQFSSTVDNTYVTDVLGLQSANVFHFTA